MTAKTITPAEHIALAKDHIDNAESLLGTSAYDELWSMAYDVRMAELHAEAALELADGRTDLTAQANELIDTAEDMPYCRKDEHGRDAADADFARDYGTPTPALAAAA